MVTLAFESEPNGHLMRPSAVLAIRFDSFLPFLALHLGRRALLVDLGEASDEVVGLAHRGGDHRGACR